MERRFSKDWWRGKQVLVLGLAKSGYAVSQLLVRLGAKVSVSDQKPEVELKGIDHLRALGIQVIAGGHPAELIHEGLEVIIKNPGIPYFAPLIQEAMGCRIPIITEVELAYHISAAPIVGITGSNGKTTTTTLVGEILEHGKLSPIVAGNIGTVLCEKAETARSEEILVAELSSFQLKGTIEFRPRIACLLNVIPAHLDYHQTWEDYITSKSKLFQNMKDADVAVLNADNEACREVAKNLDCEVSWFSRMHKVEAGCFVEDDYIYFRSASGVEEAVILIDEISIPGEHNLENVLAAVNICKQLGVSNQAIRTVLLRFKGVEHRLEFVGEHLGVKYYNDSKATNPQATMKALQSFGQPIILIAGGLDRGIDFMDLIPFTQNRVKGIVAYGQTKEKLIKMGKAAGLSLFASVENVDEAVIQASKMASPGFVVLLSPACASWDMYESFEQRGCIFKACVHKLKTSLH